MARSGSSTAIVFSKPRYPWVTTDIPALPRSAPHSRSGASRTTNHQYLALDKSQVPPPVSRAETDGALSPSPPQPAVFRCLRSSARDPLYPTSYWRKPSRGIPSMIPGEHNFHRLARVLTIVQRFFRSDLQVRLTPSAQNVRIRTRNVRLVADGFDDQWTRRRRASSSTRPHSSAVDTSITVPSSPSAAVR